MCRANIARSPLAQAALERAVQLRGAGDLVTVTSAGLRALPGHPAADESVALAAREGLDLSGHVARGLDELGPGASDVFLTMTEAQRDHLVGSGVASQRVFVLRELVQLLDAAPAAGDAQDLPGRLAAAAAQRPLVVLRDPVDVDDPWQRGAHAYERAWALIAPAAEAVVDHLVSGVREP